MSTPFILVKASMQSSSLSNSINAYYSESPVFQSLIISQLLIIPNLENINSKSWSYVTGFILHINNTFLGGSMSASGKSSIITRAFAFAYAYERFIYVYISSSVLLLAKASISILSSKYYYSFTFLLFSKLSILLEF